MGSPIKFSVIVPTRERADTLVHCLRTIVAQEYQDLDIIVSDNFSQDGTKDVVASFPDSRIKYINTGKRVSMSHNWEFALNHVKEGWVMFLGDDDGLYPWALRTLNRLIQEYKVEALRSACGSFIWPGHFEEWPRGGLSMPLTDSVKLKRSKDELKLVFSGGESAGLPWLYLGGAASIQAINRARNADGRFFCSQTPDVYSAVALSCVTEKYLFVETPIAISGASKHSNGTMGLRAVVDKDGQLVLPQKDEGNIPFHESLIIGKSLQVVYYEAYLQAQHIHKGFLNLTLDSQLKIALRAAAPAQLRDIQAQCRAIAARNGLSVTGKGGGWRSRLQSWTDFARRVFLNINIDPEQLNIVNVYDATIASAYVYKFLKNGYLGGKLDLLLINFKRVFLKVKAIVFRSAGKKTD